MHAKYGSRIALWSIAGWLALATPAAAQSTDFATCAGTSTACSSSVTTCCRSPFSPTASGNAILIPMDRCHQPNGAAGPTGPGAPLTGVGFNTGNGWCVDAAGSGPARIGGASDDGMFRAYGLVYRLMQRGIPVYWLVNASKTPPALTASQSGNYLATDVDVWVLASGVAAPPVSIVGLTDCYAPTSTPVGVCTQPVHRLQKDTLAPKLDSYRKMEFPLRGSAFLIAPDDRPKFDAFWLRTGAYASLAAQTKYDWPNSGIDLYEVDPSARIVYQDFGSGNGTGASPYALIEGAPVAVKIDYAAPRIARVGQTNAVATAWLDMAGLNDPATAASCPSGEFVPSDATYCNVSDTQVQAGVLVSGGFETAWIDDYDYGGTPCSNAAEQAMFDKLSDFMTVMPGLRNAGSSVYLSRSINISEGCANKQILGKLGTGGLDPQTGSPPGEPYILRYPANLIGQVGDVPADLSGGGVSSWRYAPGATVGYNALFTSSSSLRRLIIGEHNATAGNPQCTAHVSTVTCDVYTPGSNTGDIEDLASYAHFSNNLLNGIALYLGGNQLKNHATSLRVLFSALIVNPDETITTTPTVTEVSRSVPIVATVNSITSVYQGTYTNLDPPPSITKATTSGTLVRFKYPYLQGHLREIPLNSYTTTRQTFTQVASTATFDAADQIPSVTDSGCATKFNSSCRTVFTTIAGGRLPDNVYFTTSNVAQLGPIMASNLSTTEQQTLISRILAGTPDGVGGYLSKLGGVDRSTVAVIEESQIAGGARPTMAYFGSTDGMLHAVCVTTGNGCDRPGRELWAYIPRKLLPTLRNNLARIDGSPRVIDAYADFYNTGTKVWKTVLIFHMGSGSMNKLETTPAVYVLDITKPNAPRVLWEYSVTSVTSRATYELGVGLTVAAGPVDISGTTTNLVFAQTNNGGTGGAASVVTAINLETGARVWQHGAAYPNPRSSSHEPVPLSGIPGGAVAIDKGATGKFTDVVFGTLYGDVWQLDAATGTPRHGTSTPLLRWSSDYHPIGVSPAIFSKGGVLYAAFTTGGYADSTPTLWNGANLGTLPIQSGFAVTMNKATAGSLVETASAPDIPLKIDFNSGEGGYAQPIVVGDQVFFTTDTANVNLFEYGTSGSPTGHAYRYDFGTGTSGTTVAIAGGAASLGNSGTKMLSGTGAGAEKLSTDALSSTGTTVSPYATATTSLLRKLWLRTE